MRLPISFNDHVRDWSWVGGHCQSAFLTVHFLIFPSFPIPPTTHIRLLLRTLVCEVKPLTRFAQIEVNIKNEDYEKLTDQDLEAIADSLIAALEQLAEKLSERHGIGIEVV